MSALCDCFGFACASIVAVVNSGGLRILVDLLPLLADDVFLVLGFATVVVLAFSSFRPETCTESFLGAVAHAHRLPQKTSVVTLLERDHKVLAGWWAVAVSNAQEPGQRESGINIPVLSLVCK